MAKKEKAKTGRRETKRVRVEEKNRDSVEDETHAKLREDNFTNKIIKSQKKKKKNRCGFEENRNCQRPKEFGRTVKRSSHLISLFCFPFFLLVFFFYMRRVLATEMTLRLCTSEEKNKRK